MVKLKRSPENLELDIDVAKMGNSVFFRSKQQIPRQTAIPWHGVKIRVLRNTAGPGDGPLFWKATIPRVTVR